MLEYVDSGLIIFFLGIIILQARSLKKEITNIKKVLWNAHPEEMKKIGSTRG